MKTNATLLILFFVSLFTTTVSAQQLAAADGQARVTFMLKNTLGYHRMFRVEGPGIAYGFTMNRREMVPCTWPVGSKLYFSKDGEKTQGLILTVSAADEGKTLTTDTGATETVANVAPIAPEPKKTVAISLKNSSLLPRKIALISYEPGETGNSTNIFVLAPVVGSKTFRFPAGTRLYVADDDQVNTVMSGKRIDSGKPFLTVRPEDAGKSFSVK